MTAELSRIFDLVERWAIDAPDREALAFGDQSWTWAQLDDRVAARRERCVRPASAPAIA